MSELLDVYDLNDTFLETVERKKFYAESRKEFEKTGKITRQVKTIRVFLLNSEGRIYLQKRSKLKQDNAGLYDKTVGGHVSSGQNFDITLIRECAEELGFPAAVIDKKEFREAVKSTDLSIIGLFKQLKCQSNFESVRQLKNQLFVQPFLNMFYIGYYNGSIRFVDGESSGIEVFSLDELKEELVSNPNKFTEDLKLMLKMFEKEIKPIKEL